MANTLYYGDNLRILREHVADASVDLVYLDPPFNSNRNYNIIFKDTAGQLSKAQITAFEELLRGARVDAPLRHRMHKPAQVVEKSKEQFGFDY